MRRALLALVLLLSPRLLAQPSVIGNRAASLITPTTFAALGTPSNSSVRYCSNCNEGTFPCTGGGSGSFAYRIGGAWACPTMSAAPTASGSAGGDLSGTYPNPSVAKLNGVAYAASPSTNTVPVITAANTATYSAIGDCQDSGGNHLNFNSTTHAISCGTSSGSSFAAAGSGSEIQVRATASTVGAVTGSSFSGTALNLGANTVTDSANSAASTPADLKTGTWFTGGSATTTKPHVLIEPAGTTSTNWSTGGTGIGVNATSGFAGNLLDLQLNNTRVARFSTAVSGKPFLDLPAANGVGILLTTQFYDANPNVVGSLAASPSGAMSIFTKQVAGAGLYFTSDGTSGGSSNSSNFGYISAQRLGAGLNGSSRPLGYFVDQGTITVATQFDKTSNTTLGNVTDLSVNVVAGQTYIFDAKLFTTSNVAGGVQAAIGGTATATAIIYEGYNVAGATINAQTRATALGTAVAATTAVTAATIFIAGTITVNAAGTLTVQFAQNTSNGTASSVLVGSSFRVTSQ